MLVLPKPHVTSFTEVDEGMWQRTSRWARHAACVLEAELRPRRCYLASTGSAAGEITQSSTHLHVHVIPLYQPDDRPADIFSWSDGVYVADTEEKALVEQRLAAVKRQLTEAWAAESSEPLTIEPEIFWRRGGPPKQPEARLRQGR